MPAFDPISFSSISSMESGPIVACCMDGVSLSLEDSSVAQKIINRAVSDGVSFSDSAVCLYTAHVYTLDGIQLGGQSSIKMVVAGKLAITFSMKTTTVTFNLK